ncbi:MAG: galactokinase [Sciscionella sp.]
MPASGRAAAAFSQLHGRAPEGVWSAPGRVNLIGDHTDYNDGFVLPFALPQRTAVAAAARTDGLLDVITVGRDGRPQRSTPVAVACLEPGSVSGWRAYPYGVAWSLREQGVDSVLAGADLVVSGDVPAGAGLSSSAALECAVALALLGLDTHANIEPVPNPILAGWAQRAENEFVGAPTGVLDQTASLCCVADNVLFLDVRSGEMEQVPFDAAAAGVRVLVIDTRANHANSESGYGDRRSGCEQAARLLGVEALRDLTTATLDAALPGLPAELRALVRHVVSENQRVLDTAGLLRDGRVTEIGPLLTSSHASLRDDYRVSVGELDAAVDAALAAGALGARMTGGGFGGSVVVVALERDVPSVRRAVSEAFEGHGFTAPRMFTAAPAAGAARDW